MEQSGPPARRWPRVAAAVTMSVALVVAVVLTALGSATPVATSGAMPGMVMGGDGPRPLRLRLTDVDGKLVTVPDGRPGAVLFVRARGCAFCVEAARALAGTASRRRLSLVVVAVDSVETRADLRAFARDAGRPPARYVVDTSEGALSTRLGASALGSVLVFDRTGRPVGAPTSDLATVQASLRSIR